jgi:hypothetical protein
MMTVGVHPTLHIKPHYTTKKLLQLVTVLLCRHFVLLAWLQHNKPHFPRRPQRIALTLAESRIALPLPAVDKPLPYRLVKKDLLVGVEAGDIGYLGVLVHQPNPHASAIFFWFRRGRFTLSVSTRPLCSVGFDAVAARAVDCRL